ncbi:MAG: hypothetical protein ACM3N4_06695, partial [Nitrososphaerota archaeon]
MPCRVSRPSWMVLASSLALALPLLMVGCSLPGSPSTSAKTAAATLTVAPAKALNWQQRTLPIKTKFFDATFSLANAEAAWVCKTTDSATQVWISADQAQHWHNTTDITSADARTRDSCIVTADAIDPKTAIVTLLHDNDAITPYAQVVTHDSGQTWSTIAVPLPFATALASYHGTTYALVEQGVQYSALVASSDGLRTWHQIDEHLPTQHPDDGRRVTRLWVNSVTGELLVDTNRYPGTAEKLLISNDSGKTWNTISLSTSPSAQKNHSFIVQTPIAAGFWSICDTQFPIPASTTITLACTWNSGKTWSKRERTLAPPQPLQDIALANDDSLLSLTFDTKTFQA